MEKLALNIVPHECQTFQNFFPQSGPRDRYIRLTWVGMEYVRRNGNQRSFVLDSIATAFGSTLNH